MSKEQRAISKEYGFINKIFLFALCFAVFFNMSCIKTNSAQTQQQQQPKLNEEKDFHYMQVSNVLSDAQIPQYITTNILDNFKDFAGDLTALLQEQTDPYMLVFVDKETSLSADYAPDDLVELKNDKSYRVNRDGMYLRQVTEAALEEMAAAARAQGLTLLASSTYRSYDYQVQVYNRNVREMGQAEADRVSARPGHSQHQLGLVVDFGSITNDFANTREGRWLDNNASRYGWSISYPKDYEEVTGYDWESWHYRYVGKDAAAFIDNYFDGIQHYALKFLYWYRAP
jgi:D-alanyl-D-alanine carboxypeptidase